MIELPAIFLGLAFVVVGVAAWLLGRRSGAARTVRLPRDYYVGLDHLINDRVERAMEIFARVAQVEGDEAVEIQLALGSLFRRRGEIDRAIAIHSRLQEQGGGAVRDRAAFELALDYLGAGLMDRAERLFEELAANRDYRAAALDHLVRIYEQQGDWGNALKIFHELPPSVQLERRRVAAHYLCELAELALLQGEPERASALLRQARTHHDDLPRAELLTARMTEAAGDASTALRLYLKALEISPGLALEIIPRILALAGECGRAGVLDELADRLRRSGRLTPRQLAWLLATALPGQDPRCIAAASGEGSGGDNGGEVSSLGVVLTRIGDAGGRYQCDDCGLNSVGWYWRCPKCRSWDSMRPAVFKWAERSGEMRAT